MEGACGRIVSTDAPSVVIKQVYKRAGKQRRIRSHRAPMQCFLQETTRKMLVGLGCPTLFVPKAWAAQEHQYTMDRIDVSRPIEMANISKDAKLCEELMDLYYAAYKKGIFPCDYELYRQADSRIAMIDFDKFGTWNSDGSVDFPFGIHLTAEEVRKHTHLGKPLTFPFKN